MKAQILLPISIALTVASFGLMKIRLKDIINEEKKVKFQDVKLRVTGDVLKEYEKEQKDTQHLIEQGQIEKEQLEKTIKELQSGGLEARKGEVESCKGAKTTTTNEIASLEEQHKKLQADSAKEKTDWGAEVAALKQKLTATSPICNYLKPGSSVQDLCPEKKEEPKAEAPKPEEIKEPLKPEEKKEEPKPEEKKEPPKPEEKKEEPKAEPPKPEEPKKEAPKPEEPKPEAPKQ